MNINEELNRIIFKYEIDRYYPHYRNMYRAEKVLRRIIKELTVNKEKAMFVGDDPKGIEFIKNIFKAYQCRIFIIFCNFRKIILCKLTQ